MTNGERFDVELPYVEDEVLHLTDFIEEIGFVSNNGMGVSAVTFSEIRDWAELTEIELTPSEARALRMMSAAYAGQINSSDDSCPISDESTRESIDMVNIQAMIAMAMQ